MLRKVFKTGNSLVVSLPRDLLDPLGVHDGTHVSVELDHLNRQILIKPVDLPVAGVITSDFAQQVDEFIKQYRSALERLASTK